MYFLYLTESNLSQLIVHTLAAIVLHVEDAAKTLMRLSRNTNATIRDNRYFYTWRTNDEPHEIFRYLQLALVGYSVKDIFNITPLRQTCTLLLFESYALPMIYKYLKRFFSYTLFCKIFKIYQRILLFN